MLKSYLKIAVRNLSRHPLFAAVNVFGLAVGLAGVLLILLYVRDELSYDRFHEGAEEVYRLNWDFRYSGNEGIGAGTPPPLAATLIAEVPEVEAATRVFPVSDMVVRRGDRFFNEKRIFGVDPNFFDFFSFELVAGDPATAFEAPNSVVLTERMARKYFGDEPALGQTLAIGQDGAFLGRSYSADYRVTGVLADPPHNTHFQFDVLTSMASHPQVAFFDWSWVWMQVATYARVPDGAEVGAVEEQLARSVANHAPAAFERIGFSYDDMIAEGGRWNFVLQPMTDIHLGSGETGNRLGPVGDRTYLYIFGAVAFFLLAIACINFMNLSTARAAGRARETGVRKVLGAVRSELVARFMTEAVLMSTLAMVLAVVLAGLLVGPFGALAGKPLSLFAGMPIWLPAALVGLALGVGLLAGSYPSLYLSAFRPAQVLKGQVVSGRSGRRFRHGLVVLQFAISIALIASTLVVQQQLHYVQQADLGYARDGLVVVSNWNDRLAGQGDVFKARLEAHAGVAAAARSTGAPPDYGFQDFFKAEGHGDEQFDLMAYFVDDDFLGTLELDLLAGQSFSEDRPSSRQGLVLNESAVRLFGWEPTEALGKTVTYPSEGAFEVLGVVKDFHFMTMHQPIVPFAFIHRTGMSLDIPSDYFVARLRSEDVAGTLAGIEADWKALAPAVPFEFDFLDDRLAAAYQGEGRLATIFRIFAGLAILIACLGLFGLAAFSAERRTKEIGVRKALGASVPSLLRLLLGDFTRWVLLANLVAWPAAYLAMDRWLQGFAYRVDLGYGAFLLAGVLALAVALLTVSYQALKAARTNPVKALRYE